MIGEQIACACGKVLSRRILDRAVAVSAVVAVLTLAVPARADVARPNKPNIVVILADDLGYGDVQCYNPQRGKIPTPNIDRLASQGMRFTDAHSSSGLCSPSRCTLLTGRYHWRTRLQAGIVYYLENALIAPDRLTIAGLAKQQGYHTACVGKWHLGWNWNIPQEERELFAPQSGKVELTDRHREAWQKFFSHPIKDGPTTRGFDEYFGTDVPNWPPYCFIENDRTVGIPSTFLPQELISETLASLPGPALEDWKLEGILPTLADRAEKYIAERAKEGQPFLLYLPLTSPHTPLAVNEPWRGKSGLKSDVADFVMETDDVVGRVLEALRSNDIEDETLVIFTSDNGFAPYAGAGHLQKQGHFPSGPLRGFKGDAWEGGHRVAFVVRWPGVVRADTVCDQLAHHADVMATLAEILGTKLPANAGEDSFSLLPLLKGSDQPVRELAVCSGGSGLATLRLGSWKMLFGAGGGGPWSYASEREGERDPNPAQLYNLAEDLGETTNLYAQHPEMVEKMTALMQKLVDNGRSTSGPVQANDVSVDWRQHMQRDDKGTGR